MTVNVMDRPEEDGADRRRNMKWIGLGAAVLIGFPLALGFVAGHLDHGTGADYWHDRLVWAIPVVLLVALAAVLMRAVRPQGSGAGERREAQDRRFFYGLMGAGAVLGAVTAAGLIQADALRGGALSPAFAGVLAAAYMIVGGVATVVYYRRVDELEMQDNLWASAAGATALLFIYPPWLLLWLAGVVPEPSHVALIVILTVVASVTYLVRKARH